MKTIKEIMELIDIQDEVFKIVLEIDKKLDYSKYSKEILELQNIDTAAEARLKLQEMLAPDEKNFKMLTIMLHTMIYSYENYQKMNIDDNIFIETMKAFTRFIKEAYVANGVYSFDRDWWSYRQLSLILFRIGSLEYEMKDVNMKKYISIHIPSSADLRPESVKKSLLDAKEFFKKYYREYDNVEYFTKTWLISPDLDKLLPKDSHLIEFKNLFEIKSIITDSKNYIRLIYKKRYENVEDYPEDTTLQRNLKKYLLAGNNFNEATGIVNFDKL